MVAAILDASAPGGQMSQLPGICSVTLSQDNEFYYCAINSGWYFAVHTELRPTSNPVLKHSSTKCSEHSMWCSVDIKPFLLTLINHCFSSAGFFNGNLWKLSLRSDSDWPTDRLLRPTAAQRPGIVILNTYYSINNLEKILTMLMNSHHCTKTNIHNTLYR